jgi:predicted NAD/FAD-binding protein
MLDRDARIVIIGAGASGLATAHALRHAGHRRVTVLERGDRVGGKCCTFPFEGRTYELGAGAITSAYRAVRTLMAETGVRSTAGASGLFVELERRRSSFLPPTLRELGWWRLGSAGARLAVELWRERRLWGQPGFADVARELHAPFTEWARERRLDGVAALVEPWVTGFGYGYLDETPALYVLKYLSLFRFPVSELLETGYQGLWERVAAPLDVRLSTRIEAVRRGEREIALDLPGETLRCDALVVTTPPEETLELLDASDEELAVFGRAVCNDYHVVAAVVDRPPGARYGFLPEHFHRERSGHVLFFYRRWLDRDLVLYYCLPPDGASLDSTVDTVTADVARMGGRLVRVVRRHAWRYFPHVRRDELDAGFYSRIEALQGHRRTWFCGELFAFSSVETVVAYARDLVTRRMVSA